MEAVTNAASCDSTDVRPPSRPVGGKQLRRLTVSPVRLTTFSTGTHVPPPPLVAFKQLGHLTEQSVPVQPVEQRQEACLMIGVSAWKGPNMRRGCAPLFGLLKQDTSRSPLFRPAPHSTGKAASSCFQPWSSATRQPKLEFFTHAIRTSLGRMAGIQQQHWLDMRR